MTLPRSRTVDRVVNGQLCSGCGLCAGMSGGGIRLAAEPPGYARPVQVGPIGEQVEAAVAASCPGAKVSPWPAEGIVHATWGPIVSVENGFATDPRVRFQGSSGGAVTALAIHALSIGLVDRVVHIGADQQDPAANRILVSRSPSEVLAGAGSRYAPSSPLADIDAMLSEGGRMAFVGKPCDVSALRGLASVDPRVNAHVPVMLAFFCAGIPSRDAVSRVLAAMDATGPLASFRFRGNGWPGRATAVLANGDVKDMSYADSWGNHLSKEVQFRCKICPDAVGGVADLACADAWYGGETGYPTFEELDGRSLIVSRTEVGEALLRSAVRDGALESEPVAISEVDLMQPSQAARKRLVRARVAARAALLRAIPDMRGLRVEEAARQAPLGESARNFFGTIRRAFKGSLSRR